MAHESKYATRIPPYGLRMPDDLKARVQAAAELNNRSMNAEIVSALEEKYPARRVVDEDFAQLRVLRNMLEDHDNRTPDQGWSAETRLFWLLELKRRIIEVSARLPAEMVDQALDGLILPEEWDQLKPFSNR